MSQRRHFASSSALGALACGLALTACSTPQEAPAPSPPAPPPPVAAVAPPPAEPEGPPPVAAPSTAVGKGAPIPPAQPR